MGTNRAEEAAKNIGYIGISYKAVEIFEEGVKYGYEQAEKDTIERAVKWLEEHADEYNRSESAYDHMEEEMVADFRKAMEEE